uniref:Ribulose-1,5-bisphosphate carboxylase/oxygenase large subunit n=1 Tax=Heligmosomoides polygyrus TaxID=6339 RepID=A0A183GP31_HELPZ
LNFRFLKPDGLYMDSPENQVTRWKWDFPPLESYAEE